jgi:excisionase family DNA binding protein
MMLDDSIPQLDSAAAVTWPPEGVGPPGISELQALFGTTAADGYNDHGEQTSKMLCSEGPGYSVPSSVRMFHNVSRWFRMVQDLDRDELLTDAQLRDLLGVSRTTLWRLRNGAGLPFGKVGREYRYRKSEVLQWLKDNKARATQLHITFEQ